MGYALIYILAGFTAPMQIGATPKSLLLALPLIAVIAVAYKATKLEEIRLWSFIRECVVLFSSIVIFLVLIAVALYIVMRIAVG